MSAPVSTEQKLDPALNPATLRHALAEILRSEGIDNMKRIAREALEGAYEPTT